MENKVELVEGRWYKGVGSYNNCILKYGDPTNPVNIGYWHGYFNNDYLFFNHPRINENYEYATYEDLEKLDTHHREFCKPEDFDFLKEPKTENKDNGSRVFETGSMRDDDSDKPLVNHLDAYLRLRFGYLLREGAKKYNKGNWRKLQPIETALESLHRHLAKYELNMQNDVEQDEDHLSSIIFNVMLIMKQEERDGIKTDHFYGTMK